jgi:transposase
VFHELRARQLPVIRIDARHAKAALSLQINKTEANDALGIAQIVRVGWYREIAVKSMDSHAIRAMLVAGAQLVTQKVKLMNCIRGLLKTFGIVLATGKGRRLEAMVRERIGEDAMLTAIFELMLALLLTTREQLAAFERLVHRRARADHDVRRLISCNASSPPCRRAL